MLSIETTIERIFSTRRITRQDQYALMSMLSQGALTSSDKDLINRVYEALNQGRLRVVD